MPAVTGISHVVLTVSDLDRSSAWYQRVLSAASLFRGRNDAAGFEVAYLAEPTSGALLGLVQHDKGEGTAFTPRMLGLDHLSFAVSDRAALQEWANRLDDLEVEHNGLENQPFGTGLTLADPDGIALEFYHLVPPPAPAK